MAKEGSNIVMSDDKKNLGGQDIEEGSFSGQTSYIDIKISPIEATEKMADVGNTDGNVVDTDKWADSLECMLEDVPDYMCNQGHPGRISRLPENLREVDMKSYEPCFLSIGPYHHGKLSLERMEKKKVIVLKCFLEQKPELKLKYLLKEMKSIEPEARSFYTNVEMESTKFVQMLLLDSLYLIIVFCGITTSSESINLTDIRSTESEGKTESLNEIIDSMDIVDDAENIRVTENADKSNDETWSAENNTCGNRWFWTLLVHDLFLLENQLPFFVLQKMHNLIHGGSHTEFIVAINSMFRFLLLDYVTLDPELMNLPTEEVYHLLHLCHMYFRPAIKQDSTNYQLDGSNQLFRLGSAMQLYEAGVSFEAESSSTQHSLVDITFSSSGKMAMPCLHVDDNTNSLLRNLIALEQMKYPTLGLNVSAYAVLMLHLITIPGDVKLLRRKGIIQHHLASDKEMVCLVNRLSVGLAFDYQNDNYSLKPIFLELKRYTDNRVPRWTAWLKHKYFNNPWTTISFIAASLLLLLTAVQTYYVVYSYYHPFFDGQA